MSSQSVGRGFTRRDVLRGLTVAAGGAAVAPLLAACAPPAPATATPAPAKPAAPAAAAPTAAATPVPAAANPTAAPAAAATAPAAKPATTPAEAAGTGAAPKTVQEGFVLRPPEPNPKKGGEIKIAAGATTAHFDLHQGGSAPVLNHLYSNLVQFNLADGLRTIVPDLAIRWDASADQRTYTFRLRPGVKFHDGTPFTADDVVATFNRIISPPSGIASPNKGLYNFVDGVEKADDLSVRFSLKQPRSYFFQLLAQNSMGVYPKKALEANQNDLKKVVAPGTGPFVFGEHRQAERWVFDRNPNYYDPNLPLVNRLIYLHAPTLPDRGTAVLTGQADMSWNVAKETWEEGRKRSDRMGVSEIRNFGCVLLFINTRKKPFDDARVRRAIHLAVSRRDVIRAQESQGSFGKWTRWIPHGDPFETPTERIGQLPGYRDDKTEDIPAAKKLMAEAGYANGASGIDFLISNLASDIDILGPAFQEQLKRTLNIETKLRPVERSLLAQEEAQGRFDLALDVAGHIISDVSPLGHTYWKTGAPNNFGAYSNKKFDDLLTQYDAATDDGKRREIADQMQDALDQDPPWYLMGYTFHLPMWQKAFKGISLDSRAFVQWGAATTAWLDK